MCLLTRMRKLLKNIHAIETAAASSTRAVPLRTLRNFAMRRVVLVREVRDGPPVRDTTLSSTSCTSSRTPMSLHDAPSKGRTAALLHAALSTAKRG